MELNPVHIWHSMGFASKVVAMSLLVMGIAMLGVFIERVVYLARSSKQSRAFALKASALMKTNDVAQLTKVAVTYALSPLAKLLHAGAWKYLEYAETEETNNLPSIEAAKREMTRKAESLSAEMRRGMSVLASVGSIAPFVGLLGTVLGILAAFSKIGQAGSAGLGAVSAGIAEALVETAFGLMVAIPAVLFFNYLSGRIDGLERDLGNATGEFLDELERHHEPIDKHTSVKARKAA